ncbi:MAG TPA: Rad52/Rad22 family DNA repair protein [Aestuariivirga sp.]|nr:Rad52/Rad22 family DNA repair protein [Aestuariivirga sp.]
MAFAPTQVRKLKSKLKPAHIKTREADGNTLHYVEGWHVVAEANRIFGFDGWDRESVSSTCVWTKQTGLRYAAAYVTRVRITVRAGEERIIREGCGAGESNAASPGQAHEFAAKAAETDATKRALSTFGNSFGLSLYAGSGEQNGRRNTPASAAAVPGNGALQATHTPLTNGQGFHAPQVSLPPPAETVSSHAEAPVGDASPERRPIDKSLLAIPEVKRLRDKDHLKFVATQPCLVCGRLPAEAHHLKFSQPSALGRKVSDAFTVPLCALHHRDLHTTGKELGWWERKNIDPLPIANDLWNVSHGREEGEDAPSLHPTP